MYALVRLESASKSRQRGRVAMREEEREARKANVVQTSRTRSSLISPEKGARAARACDLKRGGGADRWIGVRAWKKV
eukprot:6195722-Pleurochrysis_carterae.AAC.1